MKNNFSKIIVLSGIGFFVIAGCDYVNDDDYGFNTDTSDVELLINEIMSNGDVADWYEIYNPTNSEIDMSGFKTWDPGVAGDPWVFPPATTIPALGYVVVICNDAAMGLETNFKLSSGGESVSLADSSGALIDEVEFPGLAPNYGYARIPDGAAFQVSPTTTPGMANDGTVQNLAPVINAVSRTPLSPTPVDDVLVEATISDDNQLASATLYYAIDDGASLTLDMINGIAESYSATIPAQVEGSLLSYWIEATDDEGLISSDPVDNGSYSYTSTTENYSASLVVNEFMASNDACCSDEFDNFDDWIEIYNFGETDIDLGGMYITDDLADITVWQIPTTAPDSTTVVAGGFLVLWADKEPEQGILHVDLKLSGGGEQIGLFAADQFNNVVIDTLSYTEQFADTSYARITDGGAEWQFDITPTPGSTNAE
jgi:hypothetical protein